MVIIWKYRKYIKYCVTTFCYIQIVHLPGFYTNNDGQIKQDIFGILMVVHMPPTLEPPNGKKVILIQSTNWQVDWKYSIHWNNKLLWNNLKWNNMNYLYHQYGEQLEKHPIRSHSCQLR